MEFRVGFARDARSQVSALLVSLCAALQSCSHGEKSLKERRGPAQICRPNRLPTIPWISDVTPSTAESAIAPGALATGVDVKRRAAEIFTDAEVRVDAF
jgi:hypothetical protein